MIKGLIEHYANVQKESKKVLEEVNEGIRKELQRREPEATVVFEFFIERLEKSENARRTVLAERRRNKLLQLTPHIRTHTIPHAHTQEPNRPQHRQEWLWDTFQRNLAREKHQKMTSYAHHTENHRGPPLALIGRCSSLHPQPMVWSFNEICSTLRNLLSSIEKQINRQPVSQRLSWMVKLLLNTAHPAYKACLNHTM